MRGRFLALVGTLAVSIPALPGGAPQVGKEHTVTIEDMKFNPPTLQVKVGDRVVWIDRDLFPHTASSVAAAFDSGAIAPDASWTYRVTTPGTFEYRCTFHPGMKGVLIVSNE